MTKLMGFTHKSGEFEGRPYDNWNLHFVEDCDLADFEGQQVFVAKVPYRTFKKTDLVVGCDYDVRYNKYGKVEGLEMLQLP